MEQEHQEDDAWGEPTTPTPSTPTTTTIREGRQRPADPNDPGSSSNRSRKQVPDALTPSPTLRVYSAHQGPTTQGHTGHYRSTTDTPGPKGGGRKVGERHDDNWWTWNQTTPHHNVPTTAPAPQTELQAPPQASVPRAPTARSIAPKTRTTVTCRGATPTTTTAPAIEAEGGHQTHTTQSQQTRCTEHSGNNPDTPTQPVKGTMTTALGRRTQPGPTGKRATRRQGAQRRLDPEQDHTPSQHTDYTGRATNQATSTTPCRRTPSKDRTEYSAQNMDNCHTPQHRAQHHDDRDNAPGPEPQTALWAMEATQPRAPQDHKHEAPLSVSVGTSSTALETHSQVSTPAEAPNPPLESLPSGLEIPANHDLMDLDNDPLQDSIQRVLQAPAAAHQRPTWITGTEENSDPGAYIQELPQDIQNANQQSSEGVVVQGRVTKTGAWTNLAGSPSAQEASTFIQESDAPPPATYRPNSGCSRPNPAELDARPHHCRT